VENQVTNSKWFLVFLMLNVGEKVSILDLGTYSVCLPAYPVPVFW
jgi:hypothetical protein